MYNFFGFFKNKWTVWILFRNQNILKEDKHLERKIKQEVRGFRTQDGAGVKLVRVLGNETV